MKLAQIPDREKALKVKITAILLKFTFLERWCLSITLMRHLPLRNFPPAVAVLGMDFMFL